MKIYISGITGTGLGPLALMAKAAGIEVFGSDLNKGAILPELVKNQIEVKIGPQDGKFLDEKIKDGVTWFVYTSALPAGHSELALAREKNLKTTKRDELTAFLVEKLGLKMVAVAGTHGKTTTTSMIVYAALKLNLPVSYIVGTTLGFAPSGSYYKNDRFLVYEADEYDRNFLKFSPWLSIITCATYDHPDIYPTREDYLAAFEQFRKQSENIIEMPEISPDEFALAGAARRQDAALAFSALNKMAPEIAPGEIIKILNTFPGVGRRFERISDGVYSDYAHHPEEIAATLDVAKDECRLRHKKGIIVLYEPHQNTRQVEIKSSYKTAFLGAEKIFWLPTFLTRENPELKVLTPADFIALLANQDAAIPAELNEEFFKQLSKYQQQDYLILLMSAGPADTWLRKYFQKP